jgi:nitrate/nitrite-specific signal transduction histidine kinase
LKVIEREISERHPSVSISECGNATSSETLGKGVTSIAQTLSQIYHNIAELLIKLTTVTRQKLQDVEVKLQVLWVAAQQVNAYQKIETCIR